LRKFCPGYNKTNLYVVNYAITRLHCTVESACQPQEGAIAAQPIRRYIGQQRNISFLAAPPPIRSLNRPRYIVICDVIICERLHFALLCLYSTISLREISYPRTQVRPN